MEAWAHQNRIVTESLAAIERGVRRNLVMCGTGGGKTWCMATLADHYRKQDKKVAVYQNRKMLLSQMSDAFTRFGVPHGVRAAGYLEEHDKLVQICSIQTENVRTNRKMLQDLHDAALVLPDEAHVLKGDAFKKILDEHVEAGASVVGFTATPIDLEDWYDNLIVAGQPSELRACGAIIPALHYGPDEPDIKALKKLRKMNAEGQDFSENQVRSAMMTPTLMARVGTWFEKLNPDHKPTLLFAPGVDESLWFAEQFTKKGIPAAHIDGDRIWVNGDFLAMGTDETKRKSRELVLKMSQRGDVRVICNRYVMREGIDAPWIRHVIAATMFGAIQSYIQSLGRGGRADRDPESIARWGPKANFTVQDHGGNWARCGSINADREWNLNYTAGMIYGLRAERIRNKKEAAPQVCYGCKMIFIGSKCICGWVPGPRRSRPVVTTDGELREMVGDIFPPRRICQKKNGESMWMEMYFRSKNYKKGRTFRAAKALYAYENDYAYPDPMWKFMPIEPVDEFRLVSDVPRERLR